MVTDTPVFFVHGDDHTQLKRNIDNLPESLVCCTATDKAPVYYTLSDSYSSYTADPTPEFGNCIRRDYVKPPSPRHRLTKLERRRRHRLKRLTKLAIKRNRCK